MSKSRATFNVEDEEPPYDLAVGDLEHNDDKCEHPPSARAVSRRVSSNYSPSLGDFYMQHPVRLTLDTGAETSMIKTSLAHQLNLSIVKSNQKALLADGTTPSNVIGEVHITPSRTKMKLTLEALVVDDLVVDILAEPAPTPWLQPQPVVTIDGKARITNDTDEPLAIRRHEHICFARHTTQDVPVINPSQVPPPPSKPKVNTPYSHGAQLDPNNILEDTIRDQFQQALLKHDRVFGSDLPGYNGAAGSIEAHVNMSPLEPPKRKGRLPLYPRNKLIELQESSTSLKKITFSPNPRRSTST
ncbi:hypothetical protein AWC38_SpisGene12692 [Stylophora pistillata]|uniref:Uncharacterized protein n=1 Tax=Stylophora pistillata TaxID=50429 RepID=A0A2B4RWE1_STYPI|nr:hypothetical protein AWC38_SpisGene12692 [Stylophora pistillata]